MKNFKIVLVRKEVYHYLKLFVDLQKMMTTKTKMMSLICLELIMLEELLEEILPLHILDHLHFNLIKKRKVKHQGVKQVVLHGLKKCLQLWVNSPKFYLHLVLENQVELKCFALVLKLKQKKVIQKTLY